MTSQIVLFLVFAFLGWILDSLYSSFDKKRLIFSGYFRGVPLCPIYGFGGILLLHSFILLASWPAILVILVSTALIISLEYLGGWWAERFLDERLWDYSKEKFNLIYISAWHSFLWLLTVGGLYLLLGAKAAVLLTYLEENLRVNSALEVLIFFVLLAIVFLLTGHQKKSRLSRIIKLQQKHY